MSYEDLPEAEIVVHEKEIPPYGAIERTYEWKGPANGVVRISRRYEKSILSEAPWVLVRIPDDDYGWLFYRHNYIRSTAWDTQFIVDIRRLFSVWFWAKPRIIMTLIVWGIGWYEAGQIVDWYCLFSKSPYRQ